MAPSVHAVVEHLFRQESGKLAASLARSFGLSKLDVVEDIVHESLLAALTSWSFHGLPENPTAWLHRVAKHKAVDHIRKRALESREAEEILPALSAAWHTLTFEHNFLPGEIEDSQLRMMFACAHPGIPVESQIALMLKTLCGFSVREIASAFLTQEATIEKRLGRARKYFRDHHVTLEPPVGAALTDRRPAVLTALYLLFNEGYKRTESEDDRSSADGLLNRDLCLEALRLALLISKHAEIRSPETDALVALMMLLAVRFDTRTAEDGSMVLLSEQDRSQWNQQLIETGMEYLRRSEPDVYTSAYHLEAGIQSLHVTATTYAETNWAAILGLYKQRYALTPSPLVAMHMAVAVAEVHGPQAALELLDA